MHMPMRGAGGQPDYPVAAEAATLFLASVPRHRRRRRLPAIDKPLSKGLAGDGTLMIFSKLRHRDPCQVLLIEYVNGAAKTQLRCNVRRHQSTALLSRLEATRGVIVS